MLWKWSVFVVEMGEIESPSKIIYYYNSFTDIVNIKVINNSKRFNSFGRFTVYFINKSVNELSTNLSGFGVFWLPRLSYLRHPIKQLVQLEQMHYRLHLYVDCFLTRL